MKSLLENFGVALCGLATSVLVALADVAIARVTGFDFFTLSVWVVIPVGAILTGFAGASGYYFGSLYFHKRANVLLLMQMVAIAGAVQLLIYLMGYATTVLEDGRKVADIIPFGQYLDIVLTTAHYGRPGTAQVGMGAVGDVGYWIAGVQFVGLLLGGVAIYAVLESKPVCGACNLYLRRLAKKRKTFADPYSAFDGYYDRVFALELDSPEFAAIIRSEAKVKEFAPGTVQVDTWLHECPLCKDQMVEEQVKSFDGKKWEFLNDLKRRVSLPSGVDVASAFRVEPRRAQ